MEVILSIALWRFYNCTRTWKLYKHVYSPVTFKSPFAQKRAQNFQKFSSFSLLLNMKETWQKKSMQPMLLTNRKQKIEVYETTMCHAHLYLKWRYLFGGCWVQVFSSFFSYVLCIRMHCKLPFCTGIFLISPLLNEVNEY